MLHPSYKLQTKQKPHIRIAPHRTTPYAPTDVKRIDDNDDDDDNYDDDQDERRQVITLKISFTFFFYVQGIADRAQQVTEGFFGEEEQRNDTHSNEE